VASVVCSDWSLGYLVEQPSVCSYLIITQQKHVIHREGNFHLQAIQPWLSGNGSKETGAGAGVASLATLWLHRELHESPGTSWRALYPAQVKGDISTLRNLVTFQLGAGQSKNSWLIPCIWNKVRPTRKHIIGFVLSQTRASKFCNSVCISRSNLENLQIRNANSFLVLSSPWNCSSEDYLDHEGFMPLAIRDEQYPDHNSRCESSVARRELWQGRVEDDFESCWNCSADKNVPRKRFGHRPSIGGTGWICPVCGNTMSRLMTTLV